MPSGLRLYSTGFRARCLFKARFVDDAAKAIPAAAEAARKDGLSPSAQRRRALLGLGAPPLLSIWPLKRESPKDARAITPTDSRPSSQSQG